MPRRIALLFLVLGLTTPSWAVYHNSAGQKISIYAYDALTSTPATYDAANIMATISLDGATSAALIDVHPAELGSGIYVFDLATTETNATMLILYAASLTTGVVIEPVTVYTQPTVSEIAIAVAAAMAPRTLDSEDYATSTTGGGLTTITTVLDVNVVEVDGEAVSVGTAPPTSATIATAVEPVIAARTLDSDDYATSSSIPVIDLSDVATSGALATAQSDLDKLTGTDGATLATLQPNYAPYTGTPPTAAAIASAVMADAATSGALATAQAAIEAVEGISPTSFTLLAKAVELAARTLPADDYATSVSTGNATEAKQDTILAQIAARTLDAEDYATSATEGLTATSFTLLAKASELTEMQGTGFTSASHSLAAIRARGDSAWVTGSGAGAITTTYTITNSATTLPIADVTVWVATDTARANIIATGLTDDFGKAVFYLDAGTYYFFRKKAGVSFSDPDTVEVSE